MRASGSSITTSPVLSPSLISTTFRLVRPDVDFAPIEPAVGFLDRHVVLAIEGKHRT